MNLIIIFDAVVLLKFCPARGYDIVIRVAKVVFFLLKIKHWSCQQNEATKRDNRLIVTIEREPFVTSCMRSSKGGRVVSVEPGILPLGLFLLNIPSCSFLTRHTMTYRRRDISRQHFG